jgi:hypothetical protein
LPRDAYGNAFKVTFAKKPKLIPLNLAMLDEGAKAARLADSRLSKDRKQFVTI